MTAGLVLAALLSGCGGTSPVIEVERVREKGRVVELGKTIDDRFFVQKKKPELPDQATQETLIADLLVWKVPKGWEQLSVKPFRLINLKFGEIECYVSFLTGGGAAGNINRWRGEMGQGPLSNAEIDKLEAVQIFERDGRLLDISGIYNPRRSAPRPGYRLRAIYADFPNFAMSVKLIGPAAEVLAQDLAFRDFCASLGFDRDKVDALRNTEDGPGSRSHNLAWDVPEGWKKGTGSSMRHVTYDVADGIQCWVTFLSGTVNGPLENINRWLTEIGKLDVDQVAADKLPRLKILGASSHYLNASGATNGVLATYTPLDGETMFVKLTGPKDAVKTQIQQFEAFCTSLRMN